MYVKGFSILKHYLQDMSFCYRLLSVDCFWKADYIINNQANTTAYYVHVTCALACSSALFSVTG